MSVRRKDEKRRRNRTVVRTAVRWDSLQTLCDVASGEHRTQIPADVHKNMALNRSDVKIIIK